LLEAIVIIARYTPTQKERGTLLRHAEMIWHDSQQEISAESDKQDIEEKYQIVEKALKS
jgi:uncharacterized membrane protein